MAGKFQKLWHVLHSSTDKMLEDFRYFMAWHRLLLDSSFSQCGSVIAILVIFTITQFCIYCDNEKKHLLSFGSSKEWIRHKEIQIMWRKLYLYFTRITFSTLFGFLHHLSDSFLRRTNHKIINSSKTTSINFKVFWHILIFAINTKLRTLRQYEWF